jgi:hypothetical protein
VDQGNECGITLAGLKFELQENDVIECYKKADLGEDQFNFAKGISKSF